MTRTPKPSFIIAFFAIEMNVITADLIGRSRNHAVLNARQVAIWIAHRQGHSYADLSRAFRRTPRGIEGVVFAFIYFRRAGRKVRLRDPVGSAGFLATYHSLMADGVPALATPTTSRPNAGTLRWLCAQYIGAKAYRELDTVFQRTRRGIIEHMLREPVFPGATETYADFPLDRLTTKALRVLRDHKVDLPEAANNRVRALRAVFKWAVAEELMTFNPARDVTKTKTSSKGWQRG